MAWSIIFTLGLIALNWINAMPTKFVHQNKTCHPVMKAHGLTGRFPGAVAHGIHSITLEDIRYYFKPDATEKNDVPSLNYDLKDPNIVLLHTPIYGYDTSFKTIGMRQLDQVLRDMDKKDWYLTKYSTLEKLAHTIHMNEVWAKAKVHYDSIALLGYNSTLCECVNDIKRSGLLQMIRFMSLKIRYPGVTAGMSLRYPDGSIAQWNDKIYTYHFFNEWSEELAKFDFNAEEEKMKTRAATELADGDEGMVHLEGAKQWATWKAGMKRMVPHDGYELAMFLFCALNH